MPHSILRNRSFVSIWLGNGVSELGGAFGTFCNSILIYELTGSTLALGSMWLLYFIPSLMLQLFIGPFIDRLSRKWIMICAQWIRGLIFLLPLVTVLSGTIESWQIYLVQIIVGLVTPLYVPANQAIIPALVSGEQLQTANAYLEGTVRMMSFSAPLLAGVVIEYTGVLQTLSLVSMLLFTSGIMLLLIREPAQSHNVRKSWLTEFREGVHFFFSQNTIVWLGIFLTFVQFGVGVTLVTTLPYITTELGGNFTEYGFFMAGFPIGFIIGALLAGKITYQRRRVVMLGALVIGGLTFIALALNQSIVLAVFIEVVGGIVMAIFSIHNLTILQQATPDHLRGKVFSVRLLMIRGALPIGVLVGGALSELWGVRPLYFFIGSIICTTALSGILLPYFKFIDAEYTEHSKTY